MNGDNLRKAINSGIAVFDSLFEIVSDWSNYLLYDLYGTNSIIRFLSSDE